MSWRARLSSNVVKFTLAHTETASSKGILNFISNSHSELELLNPGMPILVRSLEDSIGLQVFLPEEYYEKIKSRKDFAYVVAEYDWGKLDIFDVSGKTEKEIEEVFQYALHTGKRSPLSPARIDSTHDIYPGYTDKEIEKIQGDMIAKHYEGKKSHAESIYETFMAQIESGLRNPETWEIEPHQSDKSKNDAYERIAPGFKGPANAIAELRKIGAFNDFFAPGAKKSDEVIKILQNNGLVGRHV
eukprot:TRINITY_DN5186_c0_g1_i1.p1 TRINITY_DN5186_c0_g1~~TRINITY_DN5186_c0_g1_i1.p1  ORF type:complete len:244 (-),score=114.43 TRINITY_DN5186_c0_g1_i1:107-838(-)